MRLLFLAFLMGPWLAAAAPPLQVVGVVRTGLPPFEDGERLYRLEGETCQALRVNEFLTLRRAGERRQPGRLQVVVVKDGYALARLAAAGETYPLKGDRAVRHEQILPLPGLPLRMSGGPAVPAGDLAPRMPKLAVPANPSKKGIRRDSIFFLKGSPELSPAARVKLRSWVDAWGRDGRWALLVPAVPGLSEAVSRARVEALRAALKGLGVKDVELRAEPPGPLARHDAIHICREPW